MMTERFDVIIVGASLAGLSASIAAADNGLTVLCIDKKLKIGENISCAEGVAGSLLHKVPFKIPKKALSWKVNGILFDIDGIKIERRGDYWGGYTIDRSYLENWLARLARKKGVHLSMETELVGLETISGMKVVLVNINGELLRFTSDLIIAADGAQSKVANILGVGKNKVHGYVKSWEYAGLENRAQDLEQIFYGPFAPVGYGYIFPKSSTRANIGIGTPFQNADLGKLFEMFTSIESVSEQMKFASKTKEKSGIAIIKMDIPFEYNGVLFAGDAACVNLKPFVEGIIPSLCSGWLAGESIRKYSEGRYTAAFAHLFKKEKSESEKFTEILLKEKKHARENSYLLSAGIASLAFPLVRYSHFRRKSVAELQKLL